MSSDVTAQSPKRSRAVQPTYFASSSSLSHSHSSSSQHHPNPRAASPSYSHSSFSASLSNFGSSSSASTTRQTILSPFIDDEADDDDEIGHPVEFVESGHDFLPVGNPTYLSFKRKQIIKVYNKDDSGWWDGELEGRRGWFPSNYVNAPSRIDISSETMSRQTSSQSSYSSHSSRSWSRRPSEASSVTSSSGASSSSAWKRSPNPTTSPLFTSQPSLGSAQALARAANRHMIFQTPGSIMEPIVHAIALLENAVGANRVAHFQPSTACVISSIRSVLSATDCLTKEAPILRTEPALARERKQVLSELSRLVAQARRASGPMPEEAARGPEMASMLRMSTSLLGNVRSFLEVAVNCGVELPEKRGNQATILDDDHDLDRLEELEKTPTPASPRYAHAFGRASPGPNRRLQEAFKQRDPSNLAIGAKKIAALRSQRHSSEESEQTSDSDAGGCSPKYDRSRGVRPAAEAPSSRPAYLADPIDSSSIGESSWESQSAPQTPNPLAPDENGNIDALASVRISHEHLLSIIAAFIGHIHSHSASSHPSSHAHLLDVTRDCIDNVRELLTVVEAVTFHHEIRQSRPMDVSQLEIAGASLYEATAHLVSSAEAVASLPYNSFSSEQDDEERARLLHGATGTLRTAADCVQLVTRCVTRDRGFTDYLIRLDNQPPPPIGFVDPDATPRRIKQVGHRDSNTLSSLGRKATTIESLRKEHDENQLELMMDGARLKGDGQEEGKGKFASAEEEASTTKRNLSARVSQESASTSALSSSNQTFASALTSRTEQVRNLESLSQAASPVRLSDQPEGSLTLSTNSTSTDESLRTSYDSSDLGKPLIQVTSGTESPTFPDFPEDRAYHDKFIPLTPSILETSSQPTYTRRRSSSIPSRPETVIAPVPMVKASTELPRMTSGDARLWIVSHDYHPTDIAYSTEGQIVGGTLAVLVEKMTPADSSPDPSLQAVFYLTFRLFSTPSSLLAELLRRYNLTPPAGMVLGPAEQLLWSENKVMPVRLRIYNFLKTWLDVHWQAESDAVVLPKLLTFARETMAQTLPGMAPRLIESVLRRKVASGLPLPSTARTALSRAKSSDRLRGGIPMRDASSLANQPLPTPVIARGLMNNLRNQSANLSLTDFDATELARQLTIMESKLYNVITSGDLLQSGKRASPALKAMSTFSNQITGFVSEIILNEQDQKKRTALLKFFVKLTTRLVDLQNFSGGIAVLAALNGSSITRLKKTWEALPSKSKNSLHSLRALFDVSRNHAAYRARLRETAAPALPYLGLILTDLTFCNDGNADTRPAPLAPEKVLINVSKFNGLTRIISDFAKYQVPFTLAEVPEVQVFLTRVLAEKGSGSIENLYRKSLLIEPRSTRDPSNPSRV